MGWGIGFGLDENYRIYCRDGCSWKATAADYADFPVWPSALETILDVFEGELHSELDMIRDECPGTSSALANACAEEIGGAMSFYLNLSDEEKIRLHENKVAEFEIELKKVAGDITKSLEQYKYHKDAFKVGPPVYKKQAKTRSEEIERLMYPLKLELAMENSALEVDRLKCKKTRLARLLKREKKFTCE